MPSLVDRHVRLLAGLHDICAQLSVADAVREVQRHAEALFPQADLRLCQEDSGDGEAVALVARGRTIGWLVGRLDALGVADRELVQGFAEQSALAIDNVSLLEERAAMAQRDPLTGLLNHREFHERLDAALDAAKDRGAPLAVVLVDLDHFKRINDDYGHAEGDRVLRCVAGALASCCRTADPCFRVGGDEFAIMLPGSDADDARSVAARARAALREIDERVGLSFGVGCFPGDAFDKDALLAAADGQLYTAKRASDGDRGPLPAARRQHERLAVASRLSTQLAPLQDVRAIGQATVSELHVSFRYYLAVIQRLGGDGVLRIVAAAGPLTDAESGFLAYEQPVSQGVNGRVARTGRAALIPDTRQDPDYLRRDSRTDPGSELSTPIVVDGAVWGVLNLEQEARHAFDGDDVLLAETVCAQAGAALHRVRLVEELRGTIATTMATLVDVLEAQDAYTAKHARDVVELAERVGRRLGLTDEALTELRYAALLHDVGKIAVPSELLRKPTALTPEEFEQVKRHSEVGGRLLERIPFLTRVAPLVRATHERWDGGGYPDGLVGDATPLSARIVAVCDALDAMISDRPYRRALSVGEALAELSRCAATQFDPTVVAAVVAESR